MSGKSVLETIQPNLSRIVFVKWFVYHSSYILFFILCSSFVKFYGSCYQMM